jgi:hypothetical protein
VFPADPVRQPTPWDLRHDVAVGKSTIYNTLGLLVPVEFTILEKGKKSTEDS